MQTKCWWAEKGELKSSPNFLCSSGWSWQEHLHPVVLLLNSYQFGVQMARGRVRLGWNEPINHLDISVPSQHKHFCEEAFKKKKKKGWWPKCCSEFSGVYLLSPGVLQGHQRSSMKVKAKGALVLNRNPNKNMPIFWVIFTALPLAGKIFTWGEWLFSWISK